MVVGSLVLAIYVGRGTPPTEGLETGARTRGDDRPVETVAE
jgi:hypothetical protein